MFELLADTHGVALPYRFGQGITFDSDHNRVYAIGGFDGTAKGDIYAIDVPTDDCYLVSPSWTNISCVKFPGCLNCSNFITGSKVCTSPLSPCRSSNSGVNSCQYLNCSMWHSCSECVSSPVSRDPSSCQWCPCQSVCVDNRWGSTGCECDAISQCDAPPSDKCDWDNCKECQDHSGCAWIIDTMPQCVSYRGDTNHVRLNDGHCHRSCREYTTCHSCAGKKIESESGVWQCLWSETLELCISPVEQPLMCAYGQCGRVASSPSQCIQPCSNHEFCWRCIKQTTCGWCAVPDQSGKGVCMDGTIYGPTAGLCPSKTNTSVDNPINSSTAVTFSMWSFLDCPQEDECSNGHHTCREDQECKDTLKSYNCNCRAGYEEIAG